MKKALLLAFLFIAAAASCYAVPPDLMDGASLGKGKISVSAFSSSSLQQGNYNAGSAFSGSNSNMDTYLFDSSVTGVSLSYGLSDDLDLFLSYGNDKVADNEFIGSLMYPVPVVSTDSSKMLSGVSESIGLKYSFLKWPADFAIYAGYEPSAYQFQYTYTAWMMPSNTFTSKVDYASTSYTGGIVISKKLSIFTPFINFGYRSIDLRENSQDFDIHVTGTAVYTDMGLKIQLADNLSLFGDYAVEDQQWGDGEDDKYGIRKIPGVDGSTALLSGGLQIVL